MAVPEARAREEIDARLAWASFIALDLAGINPHAGPGVSVREVVKPTGSAGNILFLDRLARRTLRAKGEGTSLRGFGNQGTGYAAAAING